MVHVQHVGCGRFGLRSGSGPGDGTFTLLCLPPGGPAGDVPADSPGPAGEPRRLADRKDQDLLKGW